MQARNAAVSRWRGIRTEKRTTERASSHIVLRRAAPPSRRPGRRCGCQIHGRIPQFRAPGVADPPLTQPPRTSFTTTSDVQKPPPATRGTVQTGLRVLVAVVALNLGTYAFQLIAAQLLGPGGFGELAALLALVNLIGLPLGAVQIAVARQVAELRAAGQHHEVATFGRSFIMGALIGSVGSWWSMAAVGAPAAPAGPLIDERSAPARAGDSPSVFLPVVLGVLQGEQRFNEYSVALAATACCARRSSGALLLRPAAGRRGGGDGTRGHRRAGLALRSCAGSLAADAGPRGAVGTLRG